MTLQLPLFEGTDLGQPKEGPINVSSVPQRSPFRYPGGKTWFVPIFRKWVKSFDHPPSLLFEPFAGGGSISLTAIFEKLVQTAVLVELDQDVASVWRSILGGQAEWLALRIESFSLTRESVMEELCKVPSDDRERAFQTILRNRTLHGGILAAGSGFIKSGENGRGISSRWYPSTLARRIRAIHEKRTEFRFLDVDGLVVIENNLSDPSVMFFVDPPYTAGGKKAGTRLYRHNSVDHERLFLLCSKMAGHFLLTYDDAPEVRELARSHGFQLALVAMNNTHHATLKELIISRDLEWLDRTGLRFQKVSL